MTSFLLIVILLSLSAFFSGMEIAFLSANKLKIELAYQRGTFYGKILNTFVKKPSKFIVTVLLGNNIVLIVFGIVFAKIIEPWLAQFIASHFIILLLQTLISTTIVLFLGEYIPKVMFKAFADTILPVAALPFNSLYWLLYPGYLLINFITKSFLNLFGVKVSEKSMEFTTVDLEQYVKENMSDDDEEHHEVDKELFENVLDLKNIRVRDCMVPRREITAIDINASIQELKNLIVATYHSRILVYDDNIDKIVGYIHHFDLHKNPKNISNILMPIKIVNETTFIQKLMNEFIKEHKNIAWVVDEYGGTAGVITLEDILEEIFGEIDDEYDKDELIENQLAKNEFLLSGRTEIDHLNEEFDLNIPEGDYETLSGFIISHSETIPEKDETITIGKYQFKILDVSETKIETVKLVVLEEKES
ncbi:MAG: HlyC/CorC family transporter [Chitinophagales bacterium]|nr:HlyC/CorC family transporter [Chitinophagales bacterium]